MNSTTTATAGALVAQFTAEANALREKLRDISKHYSLDAFGRWKREMVHFISGWLRDGVDEITAFKRAAKVESRLDEDARSLPSRFCRLFRKTLATAPSCQPARSNEISDFE